MTSGRALLPYTLGALHAKLGGLWCSKQDFDLTGTLTPGVVRASTHSAPETVTRTAQYGFAADIYAFGIFTHQCLVGRIPYTPTDMEAGCTAITMEGVQSMRAHSAMLPAQAGVIRPVQVLGWIYTELNTIFYFGLHSERIFLT